MVGVALLEDLNPVQREAVAATEGPLLVVAGAGSGKTRVLTRRVAHLVKDHGVSPFAILAITFTNKAAAEMKERVAALVGPVAHDMWVSTFHSACARILRREAHRLGYKSAFSIYDSADSLRLVTLCARDLDLDSKRFVPRSLQSAISNAKNELVDYETFAQSGTGLHHEKVADVYRLYQQRLVEASAMDFDDLLMVTVELFQAFPEVLAHYQERFRYVLVDEYQDTNHAQYVLVKLLADAHQNVCVVGDQDQSVYAFRGADVRNITQFERDYPDAKVVMLEQNYRSTQTILEAANAVISNNHARKPKRLWTDLGQGEQVVGFEAQDEHDEAAYVAEEITALEKAGHRLGDIAVFYRTNAQSRVVEELMVKFAIPYQVVGGMKYYDRREVKDALAYLRAVVNPADTVAVKRIINVPKRAIGATSVGHVDRYAEAMGIGFVEALARCDDNDRLAPRAQRAIKDFVALLDHLTVQAALGPRAALEAVLGDTGYLDVVRAERTIEAMGREENLKELVSAAADFEESGPASIGPAEWVELDGMRKVQLFLESISLVTDIDSMDETDAVTLMTLHNAKGLEFGAVFMTGMEDGVFPHVRSLGEPAELEEERRLAYVGITRAKERLYMTRAVQRNLWGSTSFNVPSRFLGEIPDRLVRRATRAARRRDLEAVAPRPTVASHDVGAGDRVHHTHWGTGTITQVVGDGDGAEAWVDFDAHGVKRLLLAWAPLELLAKRKVLSSEY
ncbi:MAG TPA: DNA helicase PcrA [Acidimicrobiia bacterium]|jgi:DNA helicase-2/ATP-dependent DNA helicase PcrA